MMITRKRVSDEVLKRIITLRWETKLEDNDFYNACGICRKTYENYLNKYTSPSLDFVVKLSEITNTTLDWIMFGRGEKYVKCETATQDKIGLD